MLITVTNFHDITHIDCCNFLNPSLFELLWVKKHASWLVFGNLDVDAGKLIFHTSTAMAQGGDDGPPYTV